MKIQKKTKLNKNNITNTNLNSNSLTSNKLVSRKILNSENSGKSAGPIVKIATLGVTIGMCVMLLSVFSQSKFWRQSIEILHLFCFLSKNLSALSIDV